MSVLGNGPFTLVRVLSSNRMRSASHTSTPSSRLLHVLNRDLVLKGAIARFIHFSIRAVIMKIFFQYFFPQICGINYTVPWDFAFSVTVIPKYM